MSQSSQVSPKELGETPKPESTSGSNPFKFNAKVVRVDTNDLQTAFSGSQIYNDGRTSPNSPESSKFNSDIPSYIERTQNYNKSVLVHYKNPV